METDLENSCIRSCLRFLTVILIGVQYSKAFFWQSISVGCSGKASQQYFTGKSEHFRVPRMYVSMGLAP